MIQSDHSCSEEELTLGKVLSDEMKEREKKARERERSERERERERERKRKREQSSIFATICVLFLYFVSRPHKRIPSYRQIHSSE